MAMTVADLIYKLSFLDPTTLVGVIDTRYYDYQLVKHTTVITVKQSNYKENIFDPCSGQAPNAKSMVIIE